jgi:hypothetical protein
MNLLRIWALSSATFVTILRRPKKNSCNIDGKLSSVTNADVVEQLNRRLTFWTIILYKWRFGRSEVLMHESMIQ